MKTFSYHGFSASGRAASGLVEASDLKDAREKLAERGILAERVEPAGQVTSRFLRRASFDLAARAMLYRELAALLRAGIPLTQAFQVLLEAAEPESAPIRLADIRDRIREGAALADALVAQRGVTPFERAVVQVGERTGALDEVLDRLARFLEEQDRLREKVQAALLYPMIVLILAAGITTLTLGFLIPRVTRLMTQINLDLPALTRAVLLLGRWGLPVTAAIILPALLAGAWFWRRAQAVAEARQRWDRRRLRLPLIGPPARTLANLRFARTMALLLDGGVSLVEALPLAGEATGNRWIAALVAEQTEAIRHGRNLAEALRQIPPLAGTLPGWIQAGEASGKLSSLLEHAADRFQQQWDRVIARSLGWLEPLLILLVGGFVLLVALAILLPILSLNRVLQ